jgi:hypothetical protein
MARSVHWRRHREGAEVTISASSDLERAPFTEEQLAECATNQQLEAALRRSDQ